MKRVLENDEMVYVLILDNYRAGHIYKGKVLECIERDHWGPNKYRVMVENKYYILDYPSNNYHEEIMLYTKEEMNKYYDSFKSHCENGIGAYKRALENLESLHEELEIESGKRLY